MGRSVPDDCGMAEAAAGVGRRMGVMEVRGDDAAAAAGAVAFDPGTCCFQGAELQADVDRLVVVTDQKADDSAGRAPTVPRSSWPEGQEAIQDGSSVQVASVAWPALGELWADVDQVGPDRQVPS